MKYPISSSNPLSLRANFSWTLVGNIVYAGSSWAMLVALAKMGTPEVVGKFALALAVTAPIIMFANLQLRAIQATDAKHEYAFADYFGLRLVMLVLALLFLIGMILVSGYELEMALVILAVGFGKAADSIGDVIYGLLQQHEQMDRIAVSMIGKGILSLAALSLGQYLTHSVLWASVGWSLASIMTLLVYDIRSGKRLMSSGDNLSSRFLPRWHPATLWRLTQLALPLGFVMLLVSLNANIPRYFIEAHLGEAQLGIYAAMAYLMMVGNTVVSALGQSASPRLASYYAAGNISAFRSLLAKLLGIGMLLGCGGLLAALIAGRPILTLLYQAEYAKRADVFTWLMVAAGIGYIASLLGYGMTAARRLHPQLPLFAAVTGVTLLASLLMIPAFGLSGAAFAAIASGLTQLIGSSAINLYSLRRLDQQRQIGATA